MTPLPPAVGERLRDRDVDFTRHFIRSKNPCAEGFRWYLRHQPHGSGYQDLLDALVEAGRVGDACWLLDQLGPTNAVLQVDFLAAEAVVFAGTIEARCGIDVAGVLRAGRCIRSGRGVSAGGAIVVGGDLRARGAIRTPTHVQVEGDLRAAWGMEAGGRITCGGRLKADGPVSAGAGLQAGGDVALRDELRVRGELACGRALRVGGNIAAAERLRAGQGIECGGTITAGGHIDAGLGIRAAQDIVAGGAIRVGEGIHVGGDLRAGEGYAVHAGLGVPVDTWPTCARVSAAGRPPLLLGGSWCGAPAAGWETRAGTRDP